MTPIEPFASLAAAPLIVLLLVAWGAGEAIVLPIVPDVLIGLLVLAAPGQLGVLLGAAVLGGAVGATVDWWLLRRRPGLVDRMLAVQPALGQPGLDEAAERIRRHGLLVGFAQVGPGLPLKAYLHGLATMAPGSPTPRVVGLAVVNRLARRGPVAIAFALLHPLAVGMPPMLIGLVWIAGWTAFYLAYWVARDPRRRQRS